MYAPFFGLNQEPFSIAPDPRFLYMSERHREALAHLLYGLSAGGGFVLLTGEIGAGKTTVCRGFLEQVPRTCHVAYIFNPKLTVAELLQTVRDEFGVAVTQPGDGSEPSIKAQVDALNQFLLESHAQGRQAVLVIDEAQSLSADVLEQLRLLTNLETAERKLLQIILIGQPELRDMLARPELEQLAQRVIARYHLAALSQDETPQYIRHRLAVAGPNAPLPFDAGALAALHRHSGGVPRRINLLADRALLGAYGQGQQMATRAMVDQAATEVFGERKDRSERGDRESGVGRTRSLLASSLLPWALLAGVVAFAAVYSAWPAREGASGGAPALAAASSAAAAVAASASASGTVLAAAASGGAGSADLAAIASADGPGPRRVTDREGAAELLGSASRDINSAWRDLALRWNVAVAGDGGGDPCAALQQADIACWRSAAGGLQMVRQLGRPGLLALRTPRTATAYALLVGLNEQEALLQVGTQRWLLPLPLLAQIWQGEFNTLWRTPPGWRDNQDLMRDVSTRQWLVQQLKDGQGSGLDAASESALKQLRERLRVYQLTQGLPTDSASLPLTLMRLNRQGSVNEPRLGAAVNGAGPQKPQLP